MMDCGLAVVLGISITLGIVAVGIQQQITMVIVVSIGISTVMAIAAIVPMVIM